MSLGFGVADLGRQLRSLRSHSSFGRHLFHHLAHDHVYQQYSHCCADGSHCLGGSPAGRGQSLCFPLCRHLGSQYVFRLSLLHTAQCAGDESRRLYVYGLCQGGFAFADYYRHCHDLRASLAVPVLALCHFGCWKL